MRQNRGTIARQLNSARLVPRRPYQEFKASRCAWCGFVPVPPCQLDVDHVDGDCTNNHADNYQTLCANCHRVKSYLERLVGSGKRPDQVVLDWYREMLQRKKDRCEGDTGRRPRDGG